MIEEANSISVCLVDSPIGPMVAAATPKGLALLEFGPLSSIQPDLDKLAQQTSSKWALKDTKGLQDHPILNQVVSELEAYFSGNLKIFTTPLDPQGNGFAQEVWQTLQQIPYGETWTYKQQAASMNNPLAIRAIAATNGRNPIAIIIPCHRVIGTSGQLTGYAGGLEKKRWLLQLELANSPIRADRLF